jgi:hypothetical protein
MSNAKYTKKPYRAYTVKYSYVSSGEFKSGICNGVKADSEEEAIEIVTKNLLITHLPGYKAWIVGYRDW